MAGSRAEADRIADDAIAVIGMSGRFPGAPTLDDLWDNLVAGRDSVTDVPARRWDVDAVYAPFPPQPGKTYCRRGGFLADVDLFDPIFFGLSPREASDIDPQQRLFLEEAWRAIEDAGYADRSLSKSRCAVFVGAAPGDYPFLADETQASGKLAMGNVNSILAARISYLLDLKGPAVALDTACSSSLVALHLACQALRSGEADLALAGGVALMNTPRMHITISQSGMAAPDGLCKAFDARADGFVPAEGVGAVLLKPLRRALADNDRIHGVIRGSGINQDGRTNGLTAPSADSQMALHREVYRRYGIDPSDIGYVEAHGTGTQLGDPIEIEGLSAAFREHTSQTGFCAIGSIKTNIGHAVPAAGIAGLLKVLLCLRHGRIPPSLHFERENQALGLAGTPFFVSAALTPWPDRGSRPRLAAVSSFGFSGTNAHVVVEQAPLVAGTATVQPPVLLVPVTARTPAALREACADLAAALTDGGAPALGDVAVTLGAGRSHFRHRCVVLARSAAQLAESLVALAEGRADDPATMTGMVANGAAPPTPADAVEAIVAAIRDGAFDDRYIEASGRLAAAFVAGAVLPWDRLCPAAIGRRIGLPGYPFQRRSCWAVPLPAVPDGTSAPHAAMAGGTVVEVIEPGDARLTDHRVGGRGIMPGTAYPMMMRQAAGRILADDGFDVVDLLWERPLVAEGRPVTATVRLGAGNGSGRSVTVESPQGVHARARVLPIAVEPAVQIDLDAVRARCAVSFEAEQIYVALAERGIDYGERFRLLSRVAVGEQEALAALTAPQGGLPAALLDAALQAMIGFVLQAGGTASDTPIMLPFALERFSLAGPLPSGTAFAHLRRRVMADGEVVDVSLTDRLGCVVARLDGFTARAPRDDTAGMTLLRPVWEEAAPPVGESGTIGRPAVLFCADGTGDDLVFGAAPSLIVRFGRTLRRTPDGWEIDRGRAADFETVLDALPNDADIVFLPPAEDGDPLNPATIERAQEDGVVALFHLLKALSARPRTSRRLMVATRGVHRVVEADRGRPAGASAFGLAMVAAQELSDLEVVGVDLPDPDEDAPGEEAFRMLMQERAPSAGRMADVAYRRGRRFERRLVPARLPVPGTPPRLRHKGCYMVVGGASGIGREACRLLAREAQARIAVIGRSPPGPEVHSLLDEISAAGGAALYFQGDCADAARMGEIRHLIGADWGPIHGAIHSAVTLEDRTLVRMEEAALRRVLAPKVQGVAILAEILRDQPLDWLCLFSSSVSFTANPGQANYVAASRFEDAFAEALDRRRPGAVRLVNWGFWGSVGVVADAGLRARAEALGVASIEPKEGMAALRRILAAEVPQTIVMKLRPDAPASTGTAPRARGPSAASPAAAAGTVAGMAPDDNAARLRDRLRLAIADCLDLAASDFEDDTPFDEIGIDSVVALSIHAQLEQGFGPLSRTLLMECRSVAELAERLGAPPATDAVAEDHPAAPPAERPAVISVREGGGQPPLIWAPGLIGEMNWILALSRHLGADWPMHALQPFRPAVEPARIEDLTPAFVAAVRRVQRTGPYRLGGYSFGGCIALDIARHLEAAGETVSHVILLDSYAPTSATHRALLAQPLGDFVLVNMANLLARENGAERSLRIEDLVGSSDAERIACAARFVASASTLRGSEADLAGKLGAQIEALRFHRRLIEAQRPVRYEGGATCLLFRAMHGFTGESPDLDLPSRIATEPDPLNGWGEMMARPPIVELVEADHFSLGRAPALLTVAHRLAAHLGGGAADPTSTDPAAAGADGAKDRIFTTVRDNVLRILDHVTPDSITLDSSMKALGATSIDRVEVTICSMEALQVEIPRTRLAEVSNLRGLVDLLYEFGAGR
jgi:3-oxoacyl-(acyl-carrier-protein) synthase/thioesterase domain-containing protein/acyl carrier protein/NAD(P)-dependent dehydrogenase (short-subunit alcohol dehydrogenase family)